MPSTEVLLKAYGNILVPDRIDEMTFQEMFDRKMDRYFIRRALLRLYDRDVKTIKEEVSDDR